MVPVNSASVHHKKVSQQLQECCALFCRPRVGRVSFLIEAADVTDPDAMGVVAFTMTARLTNRPSSFDRAVQVNNIVVPYVAPASPSRRRERVPGFYVCCLIVATIGGSAAMYNDVIDITWHGIVYMKGRGPYRSVGRAYSIPRLTAALPGCAVQRPQRYTRVL